MPEEMKNDPQLYAGCMAGASLIDELKAMMEKAGFTGIRIEPKDESREFIRDWAPGRGVEDYVVSAYIEGVKPVSGSHACILRTMKHNRSKMSEKGSPLDPGGSMFDGFNIVLAAIVIAIVLFILKAVRQTKADIDKGLKGVGPAKRDAYYKTACRKNTRAERKMPPLWQAALWHAGNGE
jgi:hypothetical protein